MISNYIIGIVLFSLINFYLFCFKILQNRTLSLKCLVQDSSSCRNSTFCAICKWYFKGLDIGCFYVNWSHLTYEFVQMVHISPSPRTLWVHRGSICLLMSFILGRWFLANNSHYSLSNNCCVSLLGCPIQAFHLSKLDIDSYY